MKRLTAADAFVLLGLGTVAVGLWFIYAPLAAIWAGVLAVLFGVLYQRREGGK